MATGILPFLTIESGQEIASPPNVLRKERVPVIGSAQAHGEVLELEEILQMGPVSSSPSSSQKEVSTSTTPHELEMSQPPSPSRAADVVPNLKRSNSHYAEY
jgi:hypothetical protein